MQVFKELIKNSHEQVIYCSDEESDLKAIIAIHDTTLGPSLGGCRMWSYKNEDEALIDVLRLSRGMTYKSAAAGLNLGGGKAVIIGDAKTMKNESMFRAFGRFVQSLGGRYITAEDVGTSVSDMEWVRRETDYVTGISRSFGGSGDPSPVTALGVYHGIRAALKNLTGSDSLSGKKILIQGLGHVGYSLLEYLVEENAQIVGTDIYNDNIKKATGRYPSIKIIDPKDVFKEVCDVFAPCALGGVINDDSLLDLDCSIVAGSANNVLKDEKKHSLALAKKNILYVPDFVISAGGLINVANELEGYSEKRARHQAAGIYDIITQIFSIASKEKITTLEAAKTLAERRIKSIGSLKQNYVGVPLNKRGRGIF